MTPEQFLQTVLPPPLPDETYFAVGLIKGDRPDVAKCADAQALVARGDIHVRLGYNSYMALGSFGLDAGRTAANAKRFRSFWLDLDVDKPNNSYPSVEIALTSLLDFSKQTALMPSLLVSSGKGIHAYWALNEAIPAEHWLPIATWFKQLCQQQALIIDPAVPADMARVLRMPGTVHMSTGKPVEVLTDTGIRWDAAEFLKTVQRNLREMPAPVQQVRVQTLEHDPRMDLFGMGVEPPKAHADRIVRGCRQMATMGTGTEPQWYLAMNVLARCKEGREWAHKLSELDSERYDFNQTEAKFDRAKPDSPTTCQTFERINPDGCRGCIFKGRVRSPIELDRYVIADPSSTAHIEEAAQPEPAAGGSAFPPLHIPAEFPTPRIGFTPVPEANFRVQADGIHWIHAEKDKATKEFVDRDTVICRTQLHFKRTDLIYDDRDWQTDHVFDAVYPDNTGTKELHMFVSGFMASPERWFADHLIHPTSTSYRTQLMQFTNAYLEQVVHRAPIRHKYSHYGWTEVKDPTTGEKEMGFVTEGCVITSKGAQGASFDRLSTDNTRKVFTRCGTLDAWKLVPQVYMALNQPLGQLAICLSFAAPLMKYGSGEAKNCLFNIYSREGGRGKTHVLRFAASVWGNPIESFFQKDSSVVAREKRLALWHNMPAMMDEVSHMSDEDLSNLTFAIITGLEKQKLTQNSEFRVTGDWSTCTFTTANKSLKDAVTRHFSDTDAGALRVIDVECDFQSLKPDSPEMECVSQCTKIAEANYGLAGPEFIYQLLLRPERLQMLESTVAGWVTKNGFAPKERFYSYPLGLAMQAGRWAVEFGLLSYDMDALEKYVLEQLMPRLRGADTDIRETTISGSLDMLVTYINERILQNALIVQRDKRTKEEPEQTDSTVPDSYIARRPTQRLVIRYELENKRLFFSKLDFCNWLSLKNWSGRTTLQELKKDGYITRDDVRMQLGKHIGWLPPDRGVCVLLDKTALERCGLGKTLEVTE